MANLEKSIIVNVKQPRDFRTCFFIVSCLVKLLGESSLKICQNIDIFILLLGTFLLNIFRCGHIVGYNKVYITFYNTCRHKENY